MIAKDLQNLRLLLGMADPEALENPENDILGFWIFLMSDAVIFALLLATYGVMLPALAGGPSPASEYKIGPAFVETLLLLTSSFTFGMASVAMNHGSSRVRLQGWLGATLLLGLAFLFMELRDFQTMFADGATPMRSGYLSSFFALVPLHGLHVLAGTLWLGVMIVQLMVFDLDEHVMLNIKRLGLFWHFLDIVWIAIFSIVYLQGLVR